MPNPTLFTPIAFRGVHLRNRVAVSPMCQYSSDNGLPTDWHLVHLGSRAVGGAGLIIVEATAVSPEGRISPEDSGIWSDEHSRAFARIVKFMHEQGTAAGIQLAHAGRKASTYAPFRGQGEVPLSAGGWQTIAPSAIPFDASYPKPRAMTAADMDGLERDFVAAARRSQAAGFDVIELHMAHGYLMHEFLSPLSNQRSDEFGGSLENRMRLPLRIAKSVRQTWPKEKPLFVRISATDWVEGGWDVAQSIQFAAALREIGVDLIDCSSGGNVPGAKIPLSPGYQVQFAEAIRREAKIATGAVGLITEPAQANEIITSGKADVVLLARAMLRDPYWPLHAAKSLGVDVPWPIQYGRAK
jgi:2,4-dienoyl-CoA reductase-like NADH-dependent reductase (Old Yellow Enzyme family)